jgi:hypothetical protein
MQVEGSNKRTTGGPESSSDEHRRPNKSRCGGPVSSNVGTSGGSVR